MPVCIRCKQERPLCEFHKKSKVGDKLYPYCKSCIRVYRAERYKNLPPDAKHELIARAKQNKRKRGVRPISESKNCGSYLGIYVAERVLALAFEGVVRMPLGNKGYDFICKKGFKIDVKSSTLHFSHHHNLNGRWVFRTNENKIADYFLCLGFDNRDTLTPLKVWLIPRKWVGCRKMFGITNSEKSLRGYEPFERPIDKIVECCEFLKELGDTSRPSHHRHGEARNRVGA